MNVVTRPKSMRLARKGETLSKLLVGPDRLVTGSARDVTVALERRTLERCWSIDSDRNWIVDLFSGVLTVIGPDRIGAHDLEDGRQLWQMMTNVSGLGRWREYVMQPLAHAVALRNPNDGREVHSIELPWTPDGGGAVCGDVLITQARQENPDSPKVAALDLQQGRLLWERSLFAEMARYLKTPEKYAAMGIVPGGDSKAFVVTHGDSTFACSMADGAIQWHAPVEVTYYRPNLDGQRIYVLQENRLIAIDAVTGRIAYDVKHETLKGVFLPKTGVIYRNRLALPTESGHLAVFNTDDGRLVSLFQRKAPLWTAAEVDGRLIVGTGDGTLMVFDESIWALA